MSAEELKGKSRREPEEEDTGSEPVPMTARIIGKLSRWLGSGEKAERAESAAPELPAGAGDFSVPSSARAAVEPALPVAAAAPAAPSRPGAEAAAGGSKVDQVLAILTLERVLPELEAVRKQLSDLKESSAARIRQLETERDQVGSERRELEGRVHTLGKALDTVEQRLREEKETAEGRLRQLEAERNQSRSETDTARVEQLRQEAHVRALEEELEATKRQLAEARQAAQGKVRPSDEPQARPRALEIALRQAQERSSQLEREVAEQKALLESVQEEMASPGVPRWESTAEAVPASSRAASREFYDKAVVPLTVLVASADLLLINPKLESSVAETAREIKTQSEALLDLIKKYVLPAEAPPPAH